MNDFEITSHIDHTCLNAYATYEDIKKLCETAIRLKTASVCIPPTFVKPAYDEFGDRLAICTVIGFPLGYHSLEVKLLETAQCLADGASEIDMVINIGDAKAGRFDKITDEIRTLKGAVGKDRILKVIIETCYLTDDEKIALCKCVSDAGADYIKTSSGFGTKGATPEDVKLFRQHIAPSVKIKAAGGIRTREAMEEYLSLGCDRIGSSSAASIFEG